MTTLTLNVTKREVIGTGKLNALRAQGFVPGVIYGPAVEGNINVQAKLSDVRVFSLSLTSMVLRFWPWLRMYSVAS